LQYQLENYCKVELIIGRKKNGNDFS
jgi:hypothetical protein